MIIEIPVWLLWTIGLVVGIPIVLAILFFAWIGFMAFNPWDKSSRFMNWQVIMSEQKKPEFTKVDRALEIAVIDWLQWSDAPFENDDRMAALTLELISKRKQELTAAQEKIKALEAVELVYKDKQTEMNDLELELQALTVKHTALLEQVEKLVKSLIFYSKKDYDRVCFMDHSTCCETYGADARQALAEHEAWKKENLK